MSPEEFSQKIRTKYPNAYQDIDDVTLAQKVVEKYPVYASQVNFDTQIQPQEQEGFLQRTIGKEVKETGERLATSFEKAETVPEKILTGMTVPLRAAGATARAGGRILAEPIAGVVSKAVEMLPENKFVKNVSAGASDIAERISSGLEKARGILGEEVYQSLADTAEVALWATGARPAKETVVGATKGTIKGAGALATGAKDLSKLGLEKTVDLGVSGAKAVSSKVIEKSKDAILGLGKKIYGKEGEKVVTALEKSYSEIPLPKALLRGEAETGKSFAKFMSEKPYIPIKTKNMKYDTFASAGALREEVKVEAKALSALLESRIERVSLDTIKNEVKSAISKTVAGQERASALNYVENEFELFARQFASKVSDGTIDLTTANKLKQTMWDRSPFNPTASRMDKLSSDIDYKIGQAFKTNIENAVPDLDIKALNSQLGDYYNTIQTLEKLHGGAAPRGRIGIEFSRLAGAGIGSAGGFVGSVVGYMTAGKVAEVLANPSITTAFKRYIAQELRTARPKIADEVASMLRKQGEEQASRLRLGEGAIHLGAEQKASSVTAVQGEYAEIERLLLGEGAIPLGSKASESSVKALTPKKGLVGQDPKTGKFFGTFKN